ncbi:MAG: hypothetical protein KME59_24935 [Trichormus sp. ATA11-4-KO1]|nr:hypothetical protein [Trichormus sp. ATA11-4-KO1]
MPTARFAVSAAMPVRGLRQFLLEGTPSSADCLTTAVAPQPTFLTSCPSYLRGSLIMSSRSPPIEDCHI